MDQGSREEPGAARSQNAVHVTLREAREAARLLAGALERRSTGDATSDPQVVVVTPTADDALALSRALAAERKDVTAPPALVPLTADARARRLLAQRPAAVVGPLSVLGALMAQAQLKLSSVRTVGLLWIEELVRPESRAALEALLAELPKDAHRVALASRLEPGLEEFLDRAMWRARRVTHVPDLPPADTDVRYVLTAPEHRVAALAATLDALDPSTCVLIVSSDEEEKTARSAAHALGYGGDGAELTVSWELPESEVDLLVFFSEPPDADALRAAAAVARRVVALVPTTGLARLRGMAGAAARALLESDAFAAARSVEDALRSELREALQSGAATAHVLSLEPLIAEYDPADVAAAAVALLRRERQKGRRKPVAARASEEAPAPRAALAAPSASAAGRMARVYLSVGERDGVRRGDLVGAIAGEAEISGAQIGKIELRDSHAVVEVAAEVAARVIEKMNGTNIRGRRVVAREDREREVRSGRAGGDAHAPRGDRRPRDARGGERTGRSERSERSGRAARAPRDFVKARGSEARGSRGASRDTSRDARETRGPRAVREASEWSERAERLRNARRGPGGSRRTRETDED